MSKKARKEEPKQAELTLEKIKLGIKK